MIKTIVTITLTFLLSFTSGGWAQAKKAESVVSVKKGLNGSTLSINAKDVLMDKIIQELIEECDIKVIIYEKAITSLPVTVSFTDARFEEGIKRLIKAAGIKNHLIKYRNGSGNKSEVAELTLLGSGKKGREITYSRESMRAEREKQGQPGTGVKGSFPEKIESFKTRYQWEDTETQEIAGKILEMMPDDAKEPGLDGLISSLDKIVAEGDEVNEETLYRAIESTVPPDVAPMMMNALKESVGRYKSGEDGEVPGKSSNEVYKEFMSKSAAPQQPELPRD